MMTRPTDPVLQENEELRRRLEEAEEALRAIRAGEVDAVLVEAEREQVFTLESADKPYRLLVEQMPHGAATLTVEGAILYCNRRFADLLKRPLQALLGKLIHDFVAPDSRPRLEALLRDGQAGDVQGEVTLHRADGTPVPVYLGVNALQEGALGLCLIVTDLTEQETRKRADRYADRVARLQQVTAALAEALTVDQVAEVIITHGLAALGATVGVVATLTDDGSEFVNLRVVGYAPEVVTGWPRFPADAPLPMAEAVRLGQPIVLATLAERDARYPELARMRALEGDGALVALPLLVRGRAVGAMRLAFPKSRTFSAEDLAYMQNLAQQCAQALERARLYEAERRARERAEQEIEERKRAEEAARDSEARLRLVLDNTPAMVYLVDAEQCFTFINRRWEAIFNLTNEQVAGRSLYDFFPKDIADQFAANNRQVLEARSPLEFEEVAPHADGEHTYISVKVPLFDSAGTPYAVCGISTDITERKRAEEALQEADRRKNEFLATLAHELRNPLAPILNALHLMQLRGTEDPDLQWSQDVILRQTQQLNRLVDDLLDVSRITRGQVQLRLQPVELASVVHRAVETSQPLIDAGRHQLSVALPPEPIRLQADSTRLAQVFSNLLNNAAKYMEPGGRIWLTAERAGDEVSVRVQDAGVGIPPEMLPKVFDLFTQVDHSLDRSQGGLGIGLSLVKSLVEMHGGSVKALSEGPGRGCEFVVRLPVLAEPLSETVEAAPPKTKPHGPTFRILVVDDNVDAAQSLARLLRYQGHEVTVAHEGRAALDVAKSRKPDVILLDIGLPGMDGLDVCRSLRQHAGLEQTMLVALTGYGQDEDRRHSQEAGFHAHLAKPIEMDQLEALFARAATRRPADSQ